MNKLEKLLFILNTAIYLSIAIFSYAYVDLNLTISQSKFVNAFIIFMQQLGYFNRPVATSIYIVLIVVAFLLFMINFWLFFKSKIGINYLKISTVSITLILFFSYPFLSHDLFNYMFDAKIILNYHTSPYTHRPLDFPGDEWLRFMHWVHRYSPYGPAWLAYSLIPSVLGFGKFLLNLLTFKFFIGIFHLVNTYLIFKILGRIKPSYQLLGTSFYSSNPTLLIEGIANSHNDIVLTAFILGSIYLLLLDKKILSVSVLIAGSLVKYIPILLTGWWLRESASGKKNIERFIKWNLITMAIFTVAFSSFKISVPFVSTGATQVQFQSWYLFWTIPLISLIPRTGLYLLAASVCFGASFRYIPYLYFGDWSQPGTTQFMQIALFAPISIIMIFLLFKKIFKL